MNIFCWPSDFIIKKKEDALNFLTISKGTFYWTDGKEDFLMEDGKVSSRMSFYRGNAFIPYIMHSVEDSIRIIWITRKFINDKLRGEKT